MNETIAETLNRVSNELAGAGIVDARKEAEIMLCRACGFKGMKEIYMNTDYVPEKGERSFLARCLAKRKDRYPLPYILGKTNFFGFEFTVNTNTLIPRQETELLIEECLKFAPEKPGILEIGCGCGNISICLAKNISEARITSIDISGNAIKTARQNAKNLKTGNKIKFSVMDVLSDRFTASAGKRRYDLIVSNPPYVSAAEYTGLQKEIFYEPKEALDGGIDGLKFYRRLAQLSPLLLKKGGYIITEMGFNQSKKVKNIYNEAGLNIISIKKDYSGFDRVITAKKA